jgi:hypothetical protein
LCKHAAPCAQALARGDQCRCWLNPQTLPPPLKVWLAEWMGTQVAAKELLCLTNRAKGASRKSRARRSAAGDGEGEAAGDGAAASDSGSDRCAGAGAVLGRTPPGGSA